MSNNETNKPNDKTDLLKETEAQLNSLYKQVNRLLLWKSSLKVKINDKCPHKEIIGRVGYVSDLFPDGFTVWCKKDETNEEDFFRLPAEYLDIVEWDEAHFKEVLANFEKANKGISTNK